MKKPYTVAIYTGVSSSTTFIERLISVVADAGIPVYIFGKEKGRIQSSAQVKYLTINGRLSEITSLLKYTLLLTFFKRKDKKRLDKFIKTQSRSKYRLRLKYYPVLYHKPHIFHLQWAKGIADWIWVRDFGIKLIVSFRGAHINYSPIVDEGLADVYIQNFRKVNAFHAVSEAIKKEAGKYLDSANEVEVIKSGLDLSDFSFRDRQNFPPSVLNIISVGRNHWKKNYSTALDAMSILKSKNIPFKYTIAGVGDDEALMFQRKQLGLDDDVEFLQTLPLETIKEKISSADVLLLSSLEEGIANVVLEAMALGTLVISTDCGGMIEVVTDGKTGYLVEMRNSQAIANCIEYLYELTVEDYNRIAMEARKLIEDHHSEKKMQDQFVKLYDRVNSLDS